MGASVELWQESDGRWRWAYRDEALEILSNHPYATEPEARAAARLAYPDVPVSPEQPGPRPPESHRRASFWSFVLMVVAVWRWYRGR
jgi:hypothetical protein